MSDFISREILINSALSVLVIFAVAFIIHLISTLIRGAIGGNLVNYATIPGVMIHELSHALLAALFGAKIVEIKLFKFDQSDGSLGYVTYQPRGNIIFQSIQKVMSSCGPVIIGSILVYVLWNYVKPVYYPHWHIALKILFYYLLVCIILHISLSGADIKNMRSGLVIFILILIVIFYIFRIDLVSYIRTLFNL